MPSEIVAPMWFIVSLVIGEPPVGFGQGKLVVQRKPAVNHSLVKPRRNWPGAPLSA